MMPNNMRTKRRLIIPVVLAGGSGLRLWPLSRQNHPKSLLKLKGKLTLLKTILSQLSSIPQLSSPIVIAHVDHGALIVKQLKEIKVRATILLESEAYNTASAAAIAAQSVLTEAGNPLLLFLPVDQYIADLSQFQKMLGLATKVATEEKLVIFGVKPDSAATDYGYIERGAKLPQSTAYKVKRFKEKPSFEKATAYLKSGKYYWNSGIFFFLASTFLEELALYSPRIFSASKKVVATMKKKEDCIFLNSQFMKGCPALSIDDAILEKTKRAVVFPFKGGWHDLGNWDSLYSVGNKDKKGNVLTKNIVSFDTKNSYLYSAGQLLVTSGINNLLVVVTKDVVLVAVRDKMQDIKKIVNYLVSKKYEAAKFSPVDYRSWGYCEVIDKSQYHQIKNFFVNPQEVYVSKPKRHGATCWFVVKGKARVIIGSKVKVVSKNGAIEIAQGVKVTIKNVGKLQLHFMEICYNSVLAS